MGKIRTAKYRIEVTTDNGTHTPASWHTETYGTPNQANLARWVAKLEESTMIGGCNAHLGLTHILTAQIIRQLDNVVVVRFAAVPVTL